MSEEINLDEVAPAPNKPIKRRRRRKSVTPPSIKKTEAPVTKESAPELDPNESPESRKRKQIVAEKKAHKKNTVTGRKYYTTKGEKLVLIIEKASKDDPEVILRRYSRFVGRLKDKGTMEFLKKMRDQGKFREPGSVRLELEDKKEKNDAAERAANKEEW